MMHIPMQFDALTEMDGTIYFFDRVSNCIWKTDKNMLKMTAIRNMNKDTPFDHYAGFGIYSEGVSIYIGSHCNADIVEYSKKENRFIHYPYNESIMDCKVFHNVKVNQKIYIIPEDLNHPVLSFHTEKKKFKQEIVLTCDKTRKTFFIHQSGKVVYIPVKNSNIIYILNLEKRNVEEVHLKNKIYGNICVVKKKIFAISEKNSLLMKSTDQEKDYSLNEQNLRLKGRLISFANHIIVLPRDNIKYLCIINLEDISVSRKIEIPISQQCKLNNSGSLFYGYYIRTDEIYFLPWFLPEMYVLNFRTYNLEIKKNNIMVNRVFLDNFSGIINEKDISLSNYIEGVIN